MIEAEPTAPVTPEVEEPKPSVEDLAAHDYRELLPLFKENLDRLSLRQVKRVIMALMEYPLQLQDFSFLDPREQQLFNMGMKVFDCKYVLMKAVFELHKEKADALLADYNNLVEGEKNNGN